jgi:hypothetical protein
VIVSAAAATFATSLLALRVLPSGAGSLAIAAARWILQLLQNLAFGYLLLFGFLYLPIFVIYRWHKRRAIRWTENHMEPGVEFRDSTEYKLHKLAPYFLLAVCVLAFALFLPLCLGDLREGTYECRTIPEHIAHAIRR